MLITVSVHISKQPVSAEESSGEVVVVVNHKNPVQSLSKREVSDMFLARRRTFPSGQAVLVLEHEKNSRVRENFFSLLNQMTLKQVNAYWARLQFSGEVQPPQSLSDSRSVLEMVKRNSNAIGYMESTSVDESVRIVLHLKYR
ncbi:MAG: phosphate ABC transporter substrate-binding protein [Desulfamplus sp.]|nr:phosphate ABC transporter substrate-binding protein [Desulfamplus sp.]